MTAGLSICGRAPAMVGDLLIPDADSTPIWPSRAGVVSSDVGERGLALWPVAPVDGESRSGWLVASMHPLRLGRRGLTDTPSITPPLGSQGRRPVLEDS